MPLNCVAVLVQVPAARQSLDEPASPRVSRSRCARARSPICASPFGTSPSASTAREAMALQTGTTGRLLLCGGHQQWCYPHHVRPARCAPTQATGRTARGVRGADRSSVFTPFVLARSVRSVFHAASARSGWQATQPPLTLRKRVRCSHLRQPRGSPRQRPGPQPPPASPVRFVNLYKPPHLAHAANLTRTLRISGAKRGWRPSAYSPPGASSACTRAWSCSRSTRSRRPTTGRAARDGSSAAPA